MLWHASSMHAMPSRGLHLTRSASLPAVRAAHAHRPRAVPPPPGGEPRRQPRLPPPPRVTLPPHEYPPNIHCGVAVLFPAHPPPPSSRRHLPHGPLVLPPGYALRVLVDFLVAVDPLADEPDAARRQAAESRHAAEPLLPDPVVFTAAMGLPHDGALGQHPHPVGQPVAEDDLVLCRVHPVDRYCRVAHGSVHRAENNNARGVRVVIGADDLA